MIQDKIRELVQYGLLTGLVSAEDEIYMPPLLRVKYAALVKALNGVARTYTKINLVAR